MDNALSLTAHKELLVKDGTAAGADGNGGWQKELADSVWDGTKKHLPELTVGAALLGTAFLAGALYGSSRGNVKALAGLAASEVPISRSNVQFAKDAMLANGGKFDADHFRSLVGVSEVLSNPANAHNVFATFAHTKAAQFGVDSSKLSVPKVLEEITELSAGNVTPKALTDEIVNLARKGRGFTDAQLMEPRIANMLMDMGQYGLEMPQAINIGTKLFGVENALKDRGALFTIEAMLTNGYRASRIDAAEVHAARLLSREMYGSNGRFYTDMGHVRLNPSTVSIVRNDPTFSLASSGLSEKAFANVLKKSEAVLP